MPDLTKSNATPLEKGATVDRVYGEPIRVGDRLIVPVARVAHAYWGAAGIRRTGEEDAEPSEGVVPTGGHPDEASGTGEMRGKVRAEAIAATPAGFLEITEDETRYVSFFDYRPLLAAGLVGLALGLLLGRGSESD